MSSSVHTQPIIVVQGAFWGSEAKGAAAAFLCRERHVTAAVRTGTVNAGHTVLYHGTPHVNQQLPTAWVHRGVDLFLGPGAFIHPWILAREIAEINQVQGHDVRLRLFVDYRCGLHLPLHTVRATEANRHHKMGATGKGCSEAVVDKIRNRGNRSAGALGLFSEWRDHDMMGADLPPMHADLLAGVNLCDTVRILNDRVDQGERVLVEGTQGTLLDLHLGPYPYTTHKQTSVASWLAEAGLSPALPVEVALVTRTYPIRVAGNSGPMPREMSWPRLARRINSRLSQCGMAPRVAEDSLKQFEEACKEAAGELDPTAATLDGAKTATGGVGWTIETWPQERRELFPAFTSELHARALEKLPGPVVADLRRLFELTTVTRKLRRVAELDVDTLRWSCRLNRPTYLVLTFINHVFPESWDQDWAGMQVQTPGEIAGYCGMVEQVVGTPVRYLSTGADNRCMLRVADAEPYLPKGMVWDEQEPIPSPIRLARSATAEGDGD